MRNSKAFLKFLFCQLNLLWIFGLGIELDNFLIFSQHSLEYLYLSAIVKTLFIQILFGRLSLLNHSFFNQINLFGPAVHSVVQLPLAYFNSFYCLVYLLEASSVSLLRVMQVQHL